MVANLGKKFGFFQIKRKIASEEGCKMDLKNVLGPMFRAFKEALNNYEREIAQTPVGSRARGFESSLLNSKMIQSIQKYFPLHYKWGKYGRFTLRINGYILLFKKLNNSDMPMNIKTGSTNAINNQLSYSLFPEELFQDEPILYFGYKKDRYGQIVEPKLVYVDDSKVRWTLDERDISSGDNFSPSMGISGPSGPEPTPIVRLNARKSK